MTTKFIGTTFPLNQQYGRDELSVVDSTRQQIAAAFPDGNNLIINTTWFGPQFDNGLWDQLQMLIQQKQSFDNLFFIIVIDPIYISDEQISMIESVFGTKTTYFMGHRKDSPWYYNFEAWVLDKHSNYLLDQLALKSPDHVFLCYQRKPRSHRVILAQELVAQGLHTRGILTLGDNNDGYDWSEGRSMPAIKLDEDINNINPPVNEAFGIVNDLGSLGNLDRWQRHFLNIVSETEINNWHPLFVSEKTFKPLLGLRPFVIFGQTEVYKFLKKHGFKTFSQYWKHIPIEDGEDQLGNVVQVVKFLCEQSSAELTSMYNDMLPDLIYNRQMFFDFAKKQEYTIAHLFDQCHKDT